MRRLLALAILSVSLLGIGLSAASPAAAAPPVRAGYDECGNLQIWVNGNPTIHYLICNGA